MKRVGYTLLSSSVKTRTVKIKITYLFCQQIIYYEHAQHQHHYDHEEEEPHGWGPWSRSLFPDEVSLLIKSFI